MKTFTIRHGLKLIITDKEDGLIQFGTGDAMITVPIGNINTFAGKFTDIYEGVTPDDDAEDDNQADNYPNESFDGRDGE